MRAGLPAQGMTALHQLLVDQQKEAPSLLSTMFSSHPMSSERLNTAAQQARQRYASSANTPTQRERFMDSTASLRRIKPTITACQNGETAMASQSHSQAQTAFANARKLTPRDYAGHFRMAQCLQAQKKTQEARQYTQQAQAIYPQEAQVHKLSGVLSLSLRDPGAAFEGLDRFDRQLPAAAPARPGSPVRRQPAASLGVAALIAPSGGKPLLRATNREQFTQSTDQRRPIPSQRCANSLHFDTYPAILPMVAPTPT